VLSDVLVPMLKYPVLSNNSLTNRPTLVSAGVGVISISWDFALTGGGFVSSTRLPVLLVNSLFVTCDYSLNSGHKMLLVCLTEMSPAVRNISVISSESQGSVVMIEWSSFAKLSGLTFVAACTFDPFNTVSDTGFLGSRFL
jgi:hypothetical protein